MKKLLMATAALVFGLLSFVTPGEAHAQSIYCQPATINGTYPGIVIVGRVCNSRQIAGMGSTINDANANLAAFQTLFPDKGCRASTSPYGQIPGAFRVSFICSGRLVGTTGYIGGFGTTATDAAANAFSFAQLFAALNDVDCNIDNQGMASFAGGFKVTARCAKSGLPVTVPIDGIGSTATDAGKNARGFAELVASGVRCSLQGNVGVVGLQFKAVFYCGGTPVIGYGTTVTAAGQDALWQAQML